MAIGEFYHIKFIPDRFVLMIVFYLDGLYLPAISGSYGSVDVGTE